MTPRHVVVVPSTLLLLPEVAGLEDPVPALREAVQRAVDWLVRQHANGVAVLAGAARADNVARGAADAVGRRIARHLLDGHPVTDTAAGLLVVANGSARRSEKAPGHLDARAHGFDESIDKALRTGSPAVLRDLDVALGEELWTHDVPALRRLGELVDDPVDVQVDYADDPFGVQYWVVRWTCAS